MSIGKRHKEPLDPGDGHTVVYTRFPKYSDTRVDTGMNSCAYPPIQAAPAQTTVPTDRHPHSRHCSPPADVPPQVQIQMRVQTHPHTQRLTGSRVPT